MEEDWSFISSGTKCSRNKLEKTFRQCEDDDDVESHSWEKREMNAENRKPTAKQRHNQYQSLSIIQI